MLISKLDDIVVPDRCIASLPWIEGRRLVTSFRESCYKSDGMCNGSISSILINDRWDDEARHVVCLNGFNICGSLRLCYQKSFKLPLSVGFPEFEILNNDIEISRMIVKKEFRHGLVVLYLISSLYDIIKIDSNWRVLIDVCEGGYSNFKVSNYAKFGFNATGMSYWDARYNAKSHLLIGDPDSLKQAQNNFTKLLRRFAC